MTDPFLPTGTPDRGGSPVPREAVASPVVPDESRVIN